MLINNRYVPRHKKSFMVCHWLNGISFLMLFLTALPLYADTFLFVYNIFGAKTLQYLHRFIRGDFYRDANFRIAVCP